MDTEGSPRPRRTLKEIIELVDHAYKEAGLTNEGLAELSKAECFLTKLRRLDVTDDKAWGVKLIVLDYFAPFIEERLRLEAAGQKGI